MNNTILIYIIIALIVYAIITTIIVIQQSNFIVKVAKRLHRISMNIIKELNDENNKIN